MSSCPDIQHLEVRNGDVTLRFTCNNFSKRIRECIQNLLIDESQPDTLIRKQSVYYSRNEEVQFRLGNYHSDNDGWLKSSDISGWDAFFFENTEYPLHVKVNSNDVYLDSLTVGKEKNVPIGVEDNEIYGSLNFKNQVGKTDIEVSYKKGDAVKSLIFSTEVLSYKMDYRTDMRDVIRDIEREFAMLSYSFLKETYLTFKSSNATSPDLIWWQIFRDCFSKIINASHQIIDNPKRRLKTTVTYERAERMPYMPIDLENEYGEFKDEPAHLYRMEEMYLSKDTIENRFLKYALQSIAARFKKVSVNVLSVIKADNIAILDEINCMDETLTSINNDPFFRGIGVFKGFTQDSLVMKQAAGYKDIYEQWIILQCGYDLQDGVMQLEVKDISELYEIWCFIKVKDMVEHILRDKAKAVPKKKQVEGNFVKQLIQGGNSEVVFLENEKPNIQLASLMYNATTDNEEQTDDESGISEKTDIIETTSKTTEQRPDIVLRLSKTDNKIQFTYLFDAKYRIRDTKVGNVDVPPVDAINQLHRYRDAIYYSKDYGGELKREVIGGYVLYPGNLSREKFVGSYYHRSVDEVNIGAFPLKPGGHWIADDSDLLLDPASSEDVLYQLIKRWLEDPVPHESLLQHSIPQKGLQYHNSSVLVGLVRDSDHKQWILNQNKYNIRSIAGLLKERDGVVSLTREWMFVDHIILFETVDDGDLKFYGVFNLYDPNLVPSVYDYNAMKLLGYPFNKKYQVATLRQFKYLVYEIDAANYTSLDKETTERLKQKLIDNNFTPFIE